MGKKSEPPKGPSYEELLGLQRDQFEQNKYFTDKYLKFANKAYKDQKKLNDKIMGIQLPAMKAEAEMADLQRQRYMEMGIPQEDKQFKRMTEWDTPQRRERAAATARGDIAVASEAQRRAAEHALLSKGVDPSQGTGALDKQLRQTQAAQMALAGNQARTRVEQEGMAYGMDAVNLAKGLPAHSATALQLATNAGQTAFGNQSSVGQMGAQPYVTAGNMGAQGSQILNSAYGTAGNLHRNDLARWEMNTRYGPGAQWGQLAGAGLGAIGAIGSGGMSVPGVMGFAEGGAIPYAAEGGVPVNGRTSSLSIFARPQPSAPTTSTAIPSAPQGSSDLARLVHFMLKNKDAFPYRAEGGQAGPQQAGGSSQGAGAQPAAMPRPASQGIPPDNQPTMLSPGEFVIPDDVARWEGEKNLQKIINKAREDRVKTEQQRAANQQALGIPV